MLACHPSPKCNTPAGAPFPCRNGRLIPRCRPAFPWRQRRPRPSPHQRRQAPCRHDHARGRGMVWLVGSGDRAAVCGRQQHRLTGPRTSVGKQQMRRSISTYCLARRQGLPDRHRGHRQESRGRLADEYDAAQERGEVRGALASFILVAAMAPVRICVTLRHVFASQVSASGSRSQVWCQRSHNPRGDKVSRGAAHGVP